jgi:hypothetical protein
MIDVPAPRHRHPVVGVAGPSASGKSTLAAGLAAALGARHLCLDDYFVPGAERPVVNGCPSFERPHQYDGARMALDVAAARAVGPVVAEGFLLFAYPALLAACDVRLFVQIGEAEVVARRAARRSVGGGKAERVERAFAAHGLEEWRRFGAGQASAEGVAVLDGTLPPEELLRAARLIADGNDGRPALMGH